MVELFDCLLAGSVLRTFVQQIIEFCCQPEAASDIVSVVDIEQVGVDALVKFGDSRSNHSCDIQAADFVKDAERRRQQPTEVHGIKSVTNIEF